MISVTIEYFIKPGQEAQYEILADRIHPEVYSVDGFISVEGYESRSEPGKRLSLSLWHDEDASEPGANILNMPESCSWQGMRFSRPTASLYRRVSETTVFPKKRRPEIRRLCV